MIKTWIKALLKSSDKNPVTINILIFRYKSFHVLVKKERKANRIALVYYEINNVCDRQGKLVNIPTSLVCCLLLIYQNNYSLIGDCGNPSSF